MDVTPPFAPAITGGCLSPYEHLSTSFSTLHTDDWVGIVDDDDSFRRSLARVLRVNGIRVETFHSAEEYLDRRERAQPACLVLDIHLRGMSGLELRDRLAAEGTAPPMVFVTGHDETTPEQVGSNGVTCDLLLKPFDSAALLALVRGHLSREPSDTPQP